MRSFLLIASLILLAQIMARPNDFDLNEAKGMTADYFNATKVTISREANSIKGVDISTLVSASSASCFVSSGISSVTPRGYRSTGSVDPNVCSSIAAASNSGVAHRDTYMFPCPTCSKSAATQMQEMISFINSNCKSTFNGRVWLDIEGSQYWKGDSSANREWYQELVDACNNQASSCGIYSSKVQWEGIMGSDSYAYGSNLPLWYAHYDGKADFSDFTAFGGWTKPYAKQYAGTTTLCSMGVDMNYIPSY